MKQKDIHDRYSRLCIQSRNQHVQNNPTRETLP